MKKKHAETLQANERRARDRSPFVLKQKRKQHQQQQLRQKQQE